MPEVKRGEGLIDVSDSGRGRKSKEHAVPGKRVRQTASEGCGADEAGLGDEMRWCGVVLINKRVGA